jgi:hypothetical protein
VVVLLLCQRTENSGVAEEERGRERGEELLKKYVVEAGKLDNKMEMRMPSHMVHALDEVRWNWLHPRLPSINAV